MKPLEQPDGWEQVVAATILLNMVLLRIEGGVRYERRVSDARLEPSFFRTTANAMDALAALALLAGENFAAAMSTIGWESVTAPAPATESVGDAI